MSNKVFPFGVATVAIAAADKLAVWSATPYKVYLRAGYPNYPETWGLLKAGLANEEYVSAAFTAAGAVRIEAGASQVLYQAGTDAVIVERLADQAQGSPVAMTTAATVAVAGMLAGIITGTHAAGATQAYTLPTGAVTDAGLEIGIGESIDWSILNLSAAAADTITLTAAATGHTIVGNPIVQSANAATGGIYGNSAMFRTRKTAADTFITYRIA
jgi:hypothetical protein